MPLAWLCCITGHRAGRLLHDSASGALLELSDIAGTSIAAGEPQGASTEPTKSQSGPPSETEGLLVCDLFLTSSWQSIGVTCKPYGLKNSLLHPKHQRAQAPSDPGLERSKLAGPLQRASLHLSWQELSVCCPPEAGSRISPWNAPILKIFGALDSACDSKTPDLVKSLSRVFPA